MTGSCEKTYSLELTISELLVIRDALNHWHIGNPPASIKENPDKVARWAEDVILYEPFKLSASRKTTCAIVKSVDESL